jgi:conjugal transfer pilus assembly protein TraB
MSMLKDLNPRNIKRQQLLVAAGILGVIVIVSCIGVYVNNRMGEEKIDFDLDKSKKKIEISKLAQGSKTEDKWLQSAEGDLKAVGKQLEQQQVEKKLLEEQLTELKEMVRIYQEDHKERDNDTGLSDEVVKLREELEALKANRVGTAQSDNTQDGAAMKRIKTIDLKLDGEGEDSTLKGKKFKLAGYLPAGSYAPAVLVSGVDASVGVNSQGDPRPVLMRVTGEARSAANNGIIQKVDLVGCTVTGAASGDLSSERAFIRLVKMTCSREDETVYETELHGYVSAIGKAGVRGEVISREGDFVAQSFIAGLVSGFGDAAAQRFATPMALPSGLATETPGIKDIAGGGLGKGVSNSSKGLSEYLIKRAEQYQPVISIPAGIDVELVFNDGIYIDGRSEK